MTSKPMYKPLLCEYCGSHRIVPQVEGIPIGWVGHLYYQRKIVTRGTFAIENGTVMWTCADCLKSVMDSKWFWDDSNLDLIRTYEQELDRIFNEYEPISDEELERLIGIASVRSISMGSFHDGVTEMFIVGSGDSYKRLLKVPNKNEWIEKVAHLRLSSFQRVCSLVSNQERVEFDAWIDKQDRIVVLEKPSENRIKLTLQPLAS